MSVPWLVIVFCPEHTGHGCEPRGISITCSHVWVPCCLLCSMAAGLQVMHNAAIRTLSAALNFLLPLWAAGFMAT